MPRIGRPSWSRRIGAGNRSAALFATLSLGLAGAAGCAKSVSEGSIDSGAPGTGGDQAGSGSGGTGEGGSTTGTGGAVGGPGGAGVGGATGGGTGGKSGTGGSITGTGGSTTGAGGSITGAGGSSSTCTAGTPWTGGKTYSANTQGNVGNGYSYQLWSNGVGSGSMIVAGVDAKFSATWSSPGDFLARVGLGFNSTMTPDQLGTITANFAETKTGSGGGYNYIGIYGWSENPLHEYYIVEDWFGSRPVPGTKVGTITVDGGTYDVLTHTQTNQPAITGGNQTFVQFWSVRQTARTCGTISISQHFAGWATMNPPMQMGNLEEARLLIETGNNNGTGSINFTTATIVNN